VNRQAVRGRRDLAEAVPVSVFSPQDLAIVQGGPAGRRALLDDALRIVDHRAGALLDDLDRILRQRAALLRQAGGRLSPGVETSLEVWDARLGEVGAHVAEARAELTSALGEHVGRAYRSLADAEGPAPVSASGSVSDAGSVSLDYRRGWDGALADALLGARREDLRRGVSTVGPQRDELELRIDRRDARTQASQGEQRTLALALRLATHALVAAHIGAPPILLLDDVFSELDLRRSQALVRELPSGQSLLTTAVPLPPGVEVAQVVTVGPGGVISPGGPP